MFLLTATVLGVQVMLSVIIARHFWKAAPRGASFLRFWHRMQMAASGWWDDRNDWPEMGQAQRLNTASMVAGVLILAVGSLFLS